MKKGITSWRALIRFIFYYFSFFGLLRTLFVPWRREKYISTDYGGWKVLEQTTFFIFAVVFGFVTRLITLCIGIIVLILALVLFPLFVILPLGLRFEKLVRLGSLGREWAYPVTYTLDQHGRDMRHFEEQLVIDHDQAIAHLEQVLSRHTQQNVLLVGAQGVGKTTRLAHLARNMYRDLSVPSLNGKRLVQLFPEGMSIPDIQKCLNEAVRARNVVLVIENIERFQNLIGILEPYFDQHHFQIILTTDWANYHHTYKEHSNLMRVLEMIPLSSPSDEITLQYAQDWTASNHVHKRFSVEVLQYVIHLTNILMLNIAQPEKTIDILEELILLSHQEITKQDVEQILSLKTNVPLGALNRDEKNILLHLEERMKQEVIGQNQAIAAVVGALKRGRMNLSETKKPIGSFLFLGSTGVGKTYTAKILAASYFGGEQSMLRYDMSEYGNKENLPRFIHHLADQVESHPYGLLFFDELEKAHPDIVNLFLQILDEGMLHTETGRSVSFQNTIIICTSNAGAVYMMQNDTESRELIIEEIIKQGIFKPEFINRFDDVIVFKSLSRDAIKEITKIILHQMNHFLRKHHRLEVIITPELVDALARKGHDSQFGIRSLHRIIQNDIQNYVADFLLRYDNITHYSLMISPEFIKE